MWKWGHPSSCTHVEALQLFPTIYPFSIVETPLRGIFSSAASLHSSPRGQRSMALSEHEAYLKHGGSPRRPRSNASQSRLAHSGHARTTWPDPM